MTLQQVYYRLTDEFTVFQLSPILQEKKLRTDPDIYVYDKEQGLDTPDSETLIMKQKGAIVGGKVNLTPTVTTLACITR